MTEPVPRTAISRVTSREEPLSDMVALLTELDPGPLVALLGLPSTDIFMIREFNLSRPKSGRIDMAIFNRSTKVPLAILEAKVSDSLRDGQVEQYERWVKSREIINPEISIKRFLVDLNGTLDSPHENWNVLNQAELLGAWRASTNPHCAWLSQLLYDELKLVDTQAEEFIGTATAWSVHDVLTRRVASDLIRHLQQTAPNDWQVAPTRDAGGMPMLYIRLRHPQRHNIWLLLDLRSPGRSSVAQPWSLRIMVKTIEANFENRRDAQHQCFLAALDSLELLSSVSIEKFLSTSANTRFRPVFSLDSGGFRNNDHTASDVRGVLLDEAAESKSLSTSIPPSANRLLYQDQQLSFGTKYSLDLNQINRHDLKELLLGIILHLYREIDQPSSDQQ
jgi:hypothetical protein